MQVLNKKVFKELQKALVENKSTGELHGTFEPSKRKEGSVYLESSIFWAVKGGIEYPCSSLAEAYEKAK